MRKTGAVPIIAIFHLVLLGVVLWRQPPIPEAIARIRPERAPMLEPKSDAGMSMRMSLSSHRGTALFGRDYQIADSTLLLRAVTLLALPAFLLSMVIEALLVANSDLSLGTRSHVVGAVFLLGIVLQWLVMGWLSRRRAQRRFDSTPGQTAIVPPPS